MKSRGSPFGKKVLNFMGLILLTYEMHAIMEQIMELWRGSVTIHRDFLKKPIRKLLAESLGLLQPRSTHSWDSPLAN
jgi:hypothetical protein